MPRLGAHLSVAGGLLKALERGREIGCQTIQIFTKNNMQWKGPSIPFETANRFRQAQPDSDITPVFAHNSYLINLGAKEARLLKKSIAAMIDEIKRADQLGLPFIVIHPGSHLGAGEETGLQRIAASLAEVIAGTAASKVKLALETTAGQGTNLGYRFEHLADLLARVNQPERLAVCVDTCHIFAAGYEIRSQPAYEETMHRLDRIVGLEKIIAFHLNDSKGGLNSRLDRHEHIGRGEIGLSAFRFLLNDPRFRALPMVLETPKGEDATNDIRNLNCLRSLIRKTI